MQPLWQPLLEQKPTGTKPTVVVPVQPPVGGRMPGSKKTVFVDPYGCVCTTNPYLDEVEKD